MVIKTLVKKNPKLVVAYDFGTVLYTQHINKITYI